MSLSLYLKQKSKFYLKKDKTLDPKTQKRYKKIKLNRFDFPWINPGPGYTKSFKASLKFQKKFKNKSL